MLPERWGVVWGIFRIVLFLSAFGVGSLVLGPRLPFRNISKTQVNESAGSSLIVICDDGPVAAGPVDPGSNLIRIDCLSSKMFVVRRSGFAEQHSPVLSNLDFPRFNH